MASHGLCIPRFAAVRDEFERNFAERGEVGAAVCVTADGETVVDLWGGLAEPATGRAWERDTIGVVWSCTKGATALCAHVLASRGEIDLDAPVAAYWPEFAKNGKEAITVGMVLGHQAGLAAFREPIPDDGYLDWELVVERLAAEEPLWEPGTRHGYHALTFGHLVGEIVRRVTGRSLGSFFRDEIGDPLDLDLWIGLPEAHEARVAPTIPAEMPGPNDVIPTFYRVALTDPSSVPAMVLMHSGLLLAPGFIDTRAAHAAELPAAGGVGNARALARMYRVLALGGDVDGVHLVDAEQLVMMGAVVSATSVDATMYVPTRWSLGFCKSVDNRRAGARSAEHRGEAQCRDEEACDHENHREAGARDGVVMSEDAFGHVGMGGSIGFADPLARVSFGYTMNRQGMTIGLDTRGQALVDAMYRVLGYHAPVRGGSWYR